MFMSLEEHKTININKPQSPPTSCPGLLPSDESNAAPLQGHQIASRSGKVDSGTDQLGERTWPKRANFTSGARGIKLAKNLQGLTDFDPGEG